jgi:sugar/nucleoside kinase (ribokinase family)
VPSAASPPAFLAAGHVTWDRRGPKDVLGGTVSYAAFAAQRLGWRSAVLTAAGPEFDANKLLPGVDTFVSPCSATTRFVNLYDERGERRQSLSSRAADVDLAVLPDTWRSPDALLLGPVAGELGAGFASALEAGVVGACAQGWLRSVDADGAVEPREWRSPARDLQGVHVLFLSEKDLPDAETAAARFLEHVPIVALTRGWRGLTLFERGRRSDVPGLPREEVDPTGAGDVFAASFLVRYHETQDANEAAAFATCAASCAVEAEGTAGIGTRAEVEARLLMRERLIEEGEWE